MYPVSVERIKEYTFTYTVCVRHQTLQTDQHHRNSSASGFLSMFISSAVKCCSNMKWVHFCTETTTVTWRLHRTAYSSKLKANTALCGFMDTDQQCSTCRGISPPPHQLLTLQHKQPGETTPGSRRKLHSTEGEEWPASGFIYSSTCFIWIHHWSVSGLTTFPLGCGLLCESNRIVAETRCTI